MIDEKMTKAHTRSGLLILGRGDSPYTDRNAQRVRRSAQTAGFDVRHCDYGEALPDFVQEKVAVFLFFPHAFWNAACETPADGLLYGASPLIYRNLDNFFKGVHQKLCRTYGEERLRYVINPRQAAFDRDKIRVVKALQNKGIPTTEQRVYTTLEDILEHVSPERGIFVKCRYGAEGKGITYLGASGWFTNYKVEGGRLANYGKDERWPFTDITSRRDLLGQLMEGEVAVEREIRTPRLKKRSKFDVRAYAVNGKVPHFFARFNDERKIVTNFSQGGRVRHHPFSQLPPDYVAGVQKIAGEAARALDYRFLGVDILFDQSPDSPRVVEVQAFTDFPDVRKFDLAEYLVRRSGLLV